MRMLMKVTVPAESAGRTIGEDVLQRAMADTMKAVSAEAVYYTVENGLRTALVVFDMADSAQMPGISEPLVKSLHAQVQFMPVMNADDLKRGLPT